MCEEPRAEFFEHMDAANVDLKAFTERFYQQICAAQLENVKETLAYIKSETDVWMELATLIIPGENDSDSELDELSQWVHEALGADVPIHFSAFHPDYKMLDKPATPPATLTRAREIALGNGLRYAYTGNVHDEQGDTTFCHACGHRLIVRDWYALMKWNITDGCCPECGEACAGVFEKHPGHWGAQRQPVLIRRFA